MEGDWVKDAEGSAWVPVRVITCVHIKDMGDGTWGICADVGSGVEDFIVLWKGVEDDTWDDAVVKLQELMDKITRGRKT